METADMRELSKSKGDRHTSEFKNRLAILLCHGRSGSTLLKNLLSSHPGIVCTGEIANLNATPVARAAFHPYRVSTLSERPGLILPTKENVETLLDGYLSYLISEFDATRYIDRRILIDLKYSHIAGLCNWWYSITFRPWIATYFRKRKIPIVHLYRRNVFAAVASNHRANSQGLWNTTDAGAVKKGQTTVDRDEMLVELYGLSAEIKAWKFFTRNMRHVTLRYEEFAALDDDGRRRLTKLAAFLEGPSAWTPKEPKMQKVSPPVEQYVSNYAELADLAVRFGNVDEDDLDAEAEAPKMRIAVGAQR
jgi:hypothetical protein